MIFEPAPRKINPPLKEPKIRVGLVLPKDNLTSINFRAAPLSTLNINGEPLIGTSSPHIGSITAVGTDRVSLSLLEPQSEQSLYSVVTLQIDDSLNIDSGISLNPITVGRNFHWKKQIELTFPGTLEIRNNQGKLEVVNELPFEAYLACVVTSEMSAECPSEFMKAQIVAARSWAYVFLRDKHPDCSFDVCNDDDCQRYQGNSFLSPQALNAATVTKGEFLLQSDLKGSSYVVPAYYIKTCGGITESTSDIFGFAEESLISIIDSPPSENTSSFTTDLNSYISLPLPDHQKFYCGQTNQIDISKYLGKVDEGGSHFRWERRVSHKDLITNLRTLLSIDDISAVISLHPLTRSCGFRINKLELSYQTLSKKIKTIVIESQYRIREALDPSFLPSSAFFVQKGENCFVFNGAGWGHGVGLCQVGGVVMALEGKTYQQILTHYFPKAQLTRSY